MQDIAYREGYMLAALSRAGEASLRLYMTTMAMPKTMTVGMPMTRAATIGQKASSPRSELFMGPSQLLLLPREPFSKVMLVVRSEGKELV